MSTDSNMQGDASCDEVRDNVTLCEQCGTPLQEKDLERHLLYDCNEKSCQVVDEHVEVDLMTDDTTYDTDVKPNNTTIDDIANVTKTVHGSDEIIDNVGPGNAIHDDMSNGTKEDGSCDNATSCASSFLCEDCGASFTKQEDFETHLEDDCKLLIFCENAIPKPEVKMKEVEDNSIAVLCEFCQTIFLTEIRPVNDLVYFIKHSQLPGVCNDCNVAYRNFYSFNKKLSGFVCKRCGSFYKELNILKSHILHHSKLAKKSVSWNLPSTTQLPLASNIGGQIVTGSRNPSSASQLPSLSCGIEGNIGRHTLIVDRNIPSVSQVPPAELGEIITSAGYTQPSLNASDVSTNGSDFLFAPFFADCEMEVGEEVLNSHLEQPSPDQPTVLVINQRASKIASKMPSVPYKCEFDLPPTISSVANTEQNVTGSGILYPNDDTSMNVEIECDPAALLDVEVKIEEIDNDSDISQECHNPVSFNFDSNDATSQHSNDIKPCSVLLERVKVKEEPESMEESPSSAKNLSSLNTNASSNYHIHNPLRTDETPSYLNMDAGPSHIVNSFPSAVMPEKSHSELPPFDENSSSLNSNADSSLLMHSLFQTEDVKEQSKIELPPLDENVFNLFAQNFFQSKEVEEEEEEEEEDEEEEEGDYDEEDGDDEPRCMYCGKFFKRHETCKIHVERIHKKVYFRPGGELSDAKKCPRCKKCIKNRKAYANHMKTHAELDKLVKETMKKTVPNEAKPKEPPNLVCVHCGESFTDDDEFASHLRTHFDILKRDTWKKPLSLVCVECGKAYSDETEFATHLRTHMRKATYKRLEGKLGELFVCPRCGKATKSESRLEQHLRSHAQLDILNAEKSSTTSPPEDVFDCLRCGMSFEDETMLEAHLRTHFTPEEMAFRKHVRDLLLTCNKPVETPDESEFICPHCGKVMKQGLVFERHLLSHAKLNKLVQEKNNRTSAETSEDYSRPESRFVCYRCRKPFKDEIKFQEHLRSHSEGEEALRKRIRQSIQRYKRPGENPGDPSEFECPCCDKAMRYESTFENHLLMHAKNDQKTKKGRSSSSHS